MLKILKSRQFWAIVVLFIVNGFEGIRELISVGVLPYVDSVLGILIIYFRVKPKQKFE